MKKPPKRTTASGSEKALLTRKFYVTYGQIHIYQSSNANGFNELRKEHFEQGFAVRKGVVTFLTVEHSFTIQLTVRSIRVPEFDRLAERVIEVPLVLPADRATMSSVTESCEAKLPCACTSVLWECGPEDADEPWARISFVEHGSKSPVIHTNDGYLTRSRDFLLDTKPA